MTHTWPVAHIVLVGLMGSGKTTVGAALASAQGVLLRDSDADIERDTGLRGRDIAERDSIEALPPWRLVTSSMRSRHRPGSVIAAAASTVDDPVCRAALRDGPHLVVAHGRSGRAGPRLEPDDHRPDLGPDLAEGDPTAVNAAESLAAATSRTSHAGRRPAAAHARCDDPRAHRRRPLASGVSPPLPLILDVDTGIDDSLALLFAAASPTPTSWPRRASRAIPTPNRSGSTPGPCWSWRAEPTSKSRWVADPATQTARDGPETHGPQGLAHAAPSPHCPAARLSERHAVDLILDEARRRPGEITLVTLGPLTNLALAVMREPRLPRLLKGYTLMGGAFGVSGNTTPRAEWNIHCDPEAAKIVFRAWADAIAADPSIERPMALGLDVTEQARIEPEHVVRLARRAGSSPDDSIALERGDDPMAPQRSVPQPDRALRRGCPALLLRVPPAVRRLLRRVHPRSPRRGGDAGPHARPDRGDLRRRRDPRRAHDRDDGG